MTRREALVALAISAALITGGLTWLFGPVGMLGAGLALAVAALAVPTTSKE